MKIPIYYCYGTSAEQYAISTVLELRKTQDLIILN